MGMIVQKGAFNPLHRMHLKIAEDAIKRFPDYHHVFMLSRKTCDKGLISDQELERRAGIIKEKGYEAVYTDSGLFLDNIQEISEATPGPYTIVFPVGEDTLYRFFRDWDDFFKEDKEYGLEEYQNLFWNVIWYVTRRECPEREKYEAITAEYILRHHNIIWSDLDLDDVSSTKIREAEARAKATMRLKDIQND